MESVLELDDDDKPSMKCRRIELSKLKPGAVLSTAIVDPAQPKLKLLTAGTKIDEKFLRQLNQRGIETVILAERDIALMTAFNPQGRRIQVPPAPNYVRSVKDNDGSIEIDQLLKLGKIDALGDKPASDKPADDDGPAVSELTNRRPGTAYADGLQSEWAEECEQRIDVMADFIEDSVSGNHASTAALKKISTELVGQWIEDSDALVALAASPYQSHYPSRHGVHLASLAIAIGGEMGLGRQSLINLGIGCLIHDVGMRSVGVGLFETKEPLTSGQLRRLADHPVKAIGVATQFGDAISIDTRMVVYQIHERCDGSGYPRGYQADQIHPLAKIAAVADAFVGMVSTRKHRVAIQGYRANLALLEELKRQRFDAKVIRSLLKATSLHPIGSRVRLSNEYLGRVIRSGGDNFVRPTISMWRSDRQESESTFVDLAQDQSINITQSLPAAA